MRLFLGILVGWLFAAAVMAGVAHGIGRLHPLPAGFDPRSLLHWADYAQAAPPGALVLVAMACGCAALVACWPAARIARGEDRGPAALWIAGPLTALVIVSAALVPQPDWVVVVGMVLPIPMALLAWRLAIPRREL